MNNDIESRLRQVSPLGAPAKLRPRVLEAVTEELKRGTSVPSRHSFRPTIVVALLLFASFALNLWVNAHIDRLLNKVLKPRPSASKSPGIVADKAKETSPANTQTGFGRLTVPRIERYSASEYIVRLQHLIEQFTADSKEIADESPQKNSQMDRDHRGSLDHHRSHRQRRVRLDHGIIA